MSSVLAFLSVDLLAEADDLFKMIGPLLIFGFYIVAALAKGWAKQRQEGSEEDRSELRKAVQQRYEEIHRRQVGADRPDKQSTAQTQQPEKTTPQPQRVQPRRPVHQPSQKGIPFQADRRPRPVQMKKRLSRELRQKPEKVRAQDLKSVQKIRTARPAQPKPKVVESPQTSLASLLRQPQDLRTAVVLKEILDKPLALREF